MQKAFVIFARDKMVDIIMISDLPKSISCAGVEERNKRYRKEVIEVVQKHFLAKEEYVTLLSFQQKPCSG